MNYEDFKKIAQTVPIRENYTNEDIKKIGDKVRKRISANTINKNINYGDTLSGIASEYDTTVEQLKKINEIQDPNKIYAGDNINIYNKEVPNWVLINQHKINEIFLEIGIPEQLLNDHESARVIDLMALSAASGEQWNSINTTEGMDSIIKNLKENLIITENSVAGRTDNYNKLDEGFTGAKVTLNKDGTINNESYNQYYTNDGNLKTIYSQCKYKAGKKSQLLRQENRELNLTGSKSLNFKDMKIEDFLGMSKIPPKEFSSIQVKDYETPEKEAQSDDKKMQNLVNAYDARDITSETLESASKTIRDTKENNIIKDEKNRNSSQER